MRRGCGGIYAGGGEMLRLALSYSALTIPVAAEIKIKLEEHKQHSLIGPLNH